MANITELQLQGDSTVHKLNDARITTTVITNPTYILGLENANLNSIAPIAVANLASVLGGSQIGDANGFVKFINTYIDDTIDDYRPNGIYPLLGDTSSSSSGRGFVFRFYSTEHYRALEIRFTEQQMPSFRFRINDKWGEWIQTPSFYNNYPDIASLASALGATRESQELIVDLGLPSGRKWATHNIDVTMQNGFTKSIYQYECSFFSWGNTFGVNPISSAAFSYNWGTENNGPYASTPGASLTENAGLGYDAAFANFGNSWRLPTTEDFAELFNSSNTKYVDASGTEIADATNKLTTINGIIGICLMSKVNGKTIFFPCSGDGYGTSWNLRGSYGYYWSSSLASSTSGRYLVFSSGSVYPQYGNGRFYGFAVRPVQ